MSKISEQKALEAYPKMSRISETHRVIPADNKSHRFGDANEENREAFIKGYDQAMQDLSEKAIIAYCEVCKMPNCVTQNQKEICPYLSKFRRCLKSLLNN